MMARQRAATDAEDGRGSGGANPGEDMLIKTPIDVERSPGQGNLNTKGAILRINSSCMGLSFGVCDGGRPSRA